MKKLLFGFLIAGSLFTSCSSDDPDPVTPGGDKYMATTSGSSWNYAYVDNNDASNNGTYSLTSTNRDSLSGGITYHVYSNSDGTNEYYNITGNEYRTLQVFNLGGADTTLVNLYLNDAVAAGTSWAQTYSLDVSGVPVQVIVTNSITSRGLTKTVGATTYTNVIDVATTITIPTLATIPGSSISTNIHAYYAPKVGMIQNDAKIDLVAPLLTLAEHIDTRTTLTSATIL